MCQVETGLHFVLKADFGGARLWCKDDALPFKGGRATTPPVTFTATYRP